MIEISADVLDGMIRHSMEEFPDEACGLLAGPDGRAEHQLRMRNADQSSVTYRLDPREQLRAFNRIESEGWNLVGIYHSHTHTEAYPSETDRQQAFYPEAHYVLLSLSDRDNPVVRAYTIRDGRVDEQDVVIPER